VRRMTPITITPAFWSNRQDPACDDERGSTISSPRQDPTGSPSRIRSCVSVATQPRAREQLAPPVPDRRHRYSEPRPGARSDRGRCSIIQRFDARAVPRDPAPRSSTRKTSPGLEIV
jgi:hypothetical protein